MDKFVRTQKLIARDPLVRFIRKRLEEFRNEYDLVKLEMENTLELMKFESSRITRLQMANKAHRNKARLPQITKRVNYTRKALEYRKRTLITRSK